MAKNDYHVIVYQILSYLYQMLKNGKKVEGKYISYDNKYFQINKNYWTYIMINLLKDEYIEGILIDNIDGEEMPNVYYLDRCTITPKGIEYLCDNSFMEKAKQFFKDAKDIIPFI